MKACSWTKVSGFMLDLVAPETWISFNVSWFFISFLDLQKSARYPYMLCEICFKSIHVQWPGFPGGSDGRKNLPAIWRPRFDTRVGKFPWRREWLPLLVFLPGEFYQQGSLVGYIHGVACTMTAYIVASRRWVVFIIVIITNQTILWARNSQLWLQEYYNGLSDPWILIPMLPVPSYAMVGKKAKRTTN